MELGNGYHRLHDAARQRGGPEEAQPVAGAHLSTTPVVAGEPFKFMPSKKSPAGTGLELLTGDDTALRAAGGTRRRETAPRRLHLGPGQPDANCRDDEKPPAGRIPSHEPALAVSPEAIQARDDMQATLVRIVPCGAPRQERQVMPASVLVRMIARTGP